MFTEIQMVKIRSKFYMQAQYFQNFTNITDKDLKLIDEKIEHFNRIYLKDLKVHSYYKLEKYYTVIRYLGYNTELTFDQKVIFLIKVCDPKCLIYNNYKSLELIPKKEIEDTKDEKEKQSKIDCNESAIIGYKNATRNELGFYEAKLVKFEEAYIKLFKKEFVPCCAKDNSSLLFVGEYDFKAISSEDYLRVKKIVSDYLSDVECVDYKTVIYHILFQNNLLGLKTLTEKLLFFILVCDPDLEFLSVYYEECNWTSMKERCLDQFSYYSKAIFKIEEDYADAFIPQHKLNLWK